MKPNKLIKAFADFVGTDSRVRVVVDVPVPCRRDAAFSRWCGGFVGDDHRLCAEDFCLVLNRGCAYEN